MPGYGYRNVNQKDLDVSLLPAANSQAMGRLFSLIVAIGLFAGLAAGRLQAPRASSAEQQAILINDVAAESRSPETYAASTQATSSGGALDIPRDPNGHFYADVDINGTKVHMLIDTGATGVALSREDARSAGIATSIGMPNVVGEGADGSIHGEYVTVDRMSLGDVSAEKMDALVLNSGGQSLLGQSFLAKFASVEIHGDTMTLR